MTSSDPANKKSRGWILLVEDEENLGATLLEWLTSRDYEATWAKSMMEAIQIARSRRFDLGIFDVGLPDGSGFELARTLVQASSTKFPFLFLTAYSTPEHRVQGLEIGAQDYMVKPFHLRELELRIASILARQPPGALASTTIALFEDVQVTWAALEITNIHGTHKLSAKEAALLHLLHERRGSVVSRDAILDHVWGAEANPTPRTVDNFILKLRKLIEPHPECPQRLLSHRGIGYQLIRSP